MNLDEPELTVKLRYFLRYLEKYPKKYRKIQSN